MHEVDLMQRALDIALEQAREQIRREPKPFPTLKMADKRDLFAFAYEDFQLEGYEAHPHIKAAVAV